MSKYAFGDEYRQGDLTVTGDITVDDVTADVVTIAGLKLGYVAKSAAYTATDSDTIIEVTTTGGALTLSLPTAVGRAGKIYIIKRVGSGTNALTVDPAGSETIDGASTFVLDERYDAITIYSDGANWGKAGAGLAAD